MNNIIYKTFVNELKELSKSFGRKYKKSVKKKISTVVRNRLVFQ